MVFFYIFNSLSFIAIIVLAVISGRRSVCAKNQGQMVRNIFGSPLTIGLAAISFVQFILYCFSARSYYVNDMRNGYYSSYYSQYLNMIFLFAILFTVAILLFIGAKTKIKVISVIGGALFILYFAYLSIYTFYQAIIYYNYSLNYSSYYSSHYDYHSLYSWLTAYYVIQSIFYLIIMIYIAKKIGGMASHRVVGFNKFLYVTIIFSYVIFPFINFIANISTTDYVEDIIYNFFFGTDLLSIAFAIIFITYLRVINEGTIGVRFGSRYSLEKATRPAPVSNLGSSQVAPTSVSSSNNQKVTYDFVGVPQKPVVVDPIEKLKSVKELLDLGIISQEEFDSLKADLLKEIK